MRAVKGGETGGGNIGKLEKRREGRGERERATGQMEKKFPLLWRRDVQYSSSSSTSSSSSSRVFTSFSSSPFRFLRFLLPVCYAVSTRLGDTMHACAMGSFYRFLWFAWQSRGGVPGVVLPLHQHATQNSLAYRRNRVAFSRLTYTYTYTYIPRTPSKVPVALS